LPTKGSKLIALALVAVVVAAGFGYWTTIPRMPSETVSYTTQQTSSLSPTLRTSEAAASSTTSASETTLWINVTGTKPVSYYVSLLKSSGAQPYVQLGWELQSLPDATNTTAVAMITYLALNATNPEVKEAFQLMMKGGTPAPSDFKYAVPNYNTELQVLYWLACRNEFKKDDTLALAIAMVNGLWVTMGNEQVRQAVKNDVSDLLVFFRGTNDVQKTRGYPQLEDYPLEAMIVLADRTGKFPENQVNRVEIGLFNRRIVSIDEYEMSNVSLETLRKARDFLNSTNLIGNNPTDTFANIEKYFYMTLEYTEVFSSSRSHWRYIDWREPEAKEVGRGDVDYQFQYFFKNGYFRGGCADNAQVVNAFGMSVGIPVNMVFRINMITGENNTHAFPIYYEPISKSWRGYHGDVSLGAPSDYSQPQVVNIFRPPVQQKDYLDWSWVDRRGHVNAGFFTYSELPSFGEFLSLLSERGIATSQMKQWLL